MNTIEISKVRDMVLSKIHSDHPAIVKAEINVTLQHLLCDRELAASGVMELWFVFDDEDMISDKLSVSAIGRSRPDVTIKLIDSFNRAYESIIGVSLIAERNSDAEVYVSRYEPIIDI